MASIPAAAATPAERTASAYAARELAAAPPLGNLPDYHLAAADLLRAQHLYHIHLLTHFGGEAWEIAQLALLLGCGAVGLLSRRAQAASRNRWVQGYTFLLLFLLATTLLNLPLDVYEHLVSRRYGLSVQGWGGWFADLGKSLLLEWLVGGLLLMLLFWVIRRLPRHWWLAFWVCTVPISLFGLFAMPYVEPFFFHYEPLARAHPALVGRLEQVAERGHMHIPPDRMYLMAASAKLNTLNADVEGVGHSKRVVVWDTAVQKLTPDQILFVFGHESGHYVLGHILRGLLLSFAGSFVLLYLGFRFVRWALARFGARWGIPSQGDWGAFAVLLLAVAVMSAVTEPVAATLSRQQEHAADVYGEEAIHGLVADPQATATGAFDVLGQTSFDDPNPAPWLEFWSYDHPSIGRRAAFAHAYNPWAPGSTPRYFPRQ